MSLSCTKNMRFFCVAMSTQVQIGERLRALRKARGISVRTLASRTGFSASFISQIENGQASPSIASLERIAEVLGTTLGSFFSLQAPQVMRIIRGTERQELTSTWSQGKIEALGSSDGSNRLEVVLITLEPGGRSGSRQHTSRREQFVLILEGSIMLSSGAEAHKLKRGDAVSLNPETPHLWENKSPRPVRILVASLRLAE
jgi:transcriptional regulator with XRE-family HTH domain